MEMEKQLPKAKLMRSVNQPDDRKPRRKSGTKSRNSGRNSKKNSRRNSRRIEHIN